MWIRCGRRGVCVDSRCRWEWAILLSTWPCAMTMHPMSLGSLFVLELIRAFVTRMGKLLWTLVALSSERLNKKKLNKLNKEQLGNKQLGNKKQQLNKKRLNKLNNKQLGNKKQQLNNKQLNAKFRSCSSCLRR